MRAVVFDIDYTLFDVEEKLHDGVADLLTILRRLGFRIGALSSNDHRALVRLDEAGIRHFFDAILCTDHVKTPKTKTGLRRVLREMDIRAEHAILVSHAHSDILLGKDVKLQKTIGVTHGWEQSKPLAKAGADHVVENVSAVLDVVE